MVRRSALRAKNYPVTLLVNMPLEITTLVCEDMSVQTSSLTLAQILQYLLPIDILYFSWTCRDAYQALNNPNLRYIWEKARSNYIFGYIPHPPEGMSEGTYAQLLFHRKCNVSLSLNPNIRI